METTISVLTSIEGLPLRLRRANNAGGYTLTAARVAFNAVTGSPANIQVAIHSDSSSLPGASLGALTGVNPTADGQFDYTTAGLALSANTTYHLVLLAPGSPTGANNHYNPDSTFSDAQTSSDGWTIADGHRGSINGGTTWNNFGNNSLQFSITATPVPEPHEYAMLVGLGLMGFVVARRHLVSKALT